MDYARWKVYFKWIMPPEIAGLAPRTNLIFSPATAGAVTDGCEGIIQPRVAEAGSKAKMPKNNQRQVRICYLHDNCVVICK